MISGEINADGEVNFSVCRAVFALGENWSDGELERVERKLKICQPTTVCNNGTQKYNT